MAIINYIVNWDTIPYPYTWAAQDYHGAVYAYRLRPTTEDAEWVPVATENSPCVKLHTPPLGTVVTGWRSSLVRRPVDTKVEEYTPHKHADSMLKYAEDAATTETPWLLWEARSFTQDSWQQLPDHPKWSCDMRYRRIREGHVTITVSRDTVERLLGCFVVAEKDNSPLATVIKALKEQLK